MFPLLGLWRPLKNNSLHKTLPLLYLVRVRWLGFGKGPPVMMIDSYLSDALCVLHSYSGT